MKVSLNWIKQFTTLPGDVQLVTDKIGAQLGALEGVDDMTHLYDGVIAARVVSCEQHPNADRLHVCLIDDGGRAEGVGRNAEGLVQVVCGAPNVREGLMVAWLPPTATVPATARTADPFVLEARELRGVVSNGMLASPKELALWDSHEGILEVDKEVAPGTPFAEVYALDDYIIDIENKMFTHRPDCFGQLGVAREVAGIFGQTFRSPEWYLAADSSVLARDAASDLPLEVHNELPNLVPRFMAVALSDITIKPSPVELQTYLSRIGIRPINNVVDITNYMMVLTGQPLHAYDYDKVRAQDPGADHATLLARNPRDSEQLTLLSGKTVQPRSEAILIATAERAIGIGGVMGGADTEVDENTKTIILECASFDMYSIRRTSMAHGLFTDAVTRFNKGQSPLQNDRILAKSVEMLRDLAGAKVASEVSDINQLSEHGAVRAWVHPPVPVRPDFINSRLGLDLSANDIKTLLEHVECSVDITDDGLVVTAPFWRTDIETREDVIEEVGRLYGFDKLPLELPKRKIAPAVKDEVLERKARTRAVLSRAGANEVLTYSFVHGDLFDKVGQDKQEAFRLSNALSPDLQYYRLSLLPSLLTNIYANIRAGYGELALFETGVVHGKSEHDEQGLPNEFGRLALVVAADKKTATQQHAGAPYYQALRYLGVALHCDTSGLTLRPLNAAELPDHALFHQMLAPFDAERSALVYVGDKLAGVVGEFTRSTRRAFKLPDYCAGFEVFSSVLPTEPPVVYTQLPRFPRVEQDICLKVSATTSFSELYQLVSESLASTRPERVLDELTPVDIYQREDDSAHKQITFHYSIASYDRTLTDSEVTGMLDHVAAAAHDKLQAERV